MWGCRSSRPRVTVSTEALEVTIVSLLNFPLFITRPFEHTVSIWCFLHVPLLLGNDLRQLDNATLSIIRSKGLIALNQDPLAYPGRIVPATVRADEGTEVWEKQLHSGSVALMLLNKGPGKEYECTSPAANITAEFALIPGIVTGTSVQVRDVRSGADLGTHSRSLTLEVPCHGTRVLLLAPEGKGGMGW